MSKLDPAPFTRLTLSSHGDDPLERPLAAISVVSSYYGYLIFSLFVTLF